MLTSMRKFRQILSVLLIALVAASAVALPASAFVALGKSAEAASSDCPCPKSDCAKNSHCANVACVSVCANFVAAYVPVAEWTPIFSKSDTSEQAQTDHPTLDRPPPLPPPRA